MFPACKFTSCISLVFVPAWSSSQLKDLVDEGEMAELRAREKRVDVEVDWALDVFMKACSVAGKRESIITDYVLRLLDLELCQDTLVGNDWFRGVSGGQRKRVTAGKTLEATIRNELILAHGRSKSKATSYLCLRLMGVVVAQHN
jgi:hypothetical protein